MRIAVIADIHANLEALRAALERIHDCKADETVCLGDIVGYNANPNECVEILRSEGTLCVLGNHDAVASGLEEPDSFNPLAAAAVLWTRNQLTEENRQFLASLPRERDFRGSHLFHGSIHDTDRYILYREDVADNFRLLSSLAGDPAMGFFGHTHVPTALAEQRGVISTLPGVEQMELWPGKRYLINPGSVGQPRDGDQRAAFLLWDETDRRIAFHRVAYDVGTCQDKIIRAGLPPKLAERLEEGR